MEITLPKLLLSYFSVILIYLYILFLAIPIGNIMLTNPKYTTLLSHISLILPFVVM
jgi:hypothetical protein